jgi:phosphatidyl-myo-inositol dimannoside synthase
MRKPALAAITLDPTGGGVALVSRLLWRSFQARWGDATRLVTMFDHETRPATLFEKCRFGTSVFGAQTLHGHDFVLFAHVGLARVQNGIADAFRKPYAVFIHGIEAWNTLTPGEELALKRATLRLANSRYTAQRVTDAHPQIGPIHVCPLALPPNGTRQPAPAAQRKPHVLVVGRMASTERYKGHDQLLLAWPAVVKSMPEARLIVAGGGDDCSRLQAEAVRLAVADSVVFPGFVDHDHLDRLYREAAVFALPSRGEGFGLVYLEAMSHGLPCVGSTVDAASEVIVHDVTGHLVNPDSPADLAAALVRLLTDAALRERMGAAGHTRVRDVFSYDRFDARVQELLTTAAAATS